MEYQYKLIVGPVVSDKEISKFEENINELINNDWSLVGGPTIIVTEKIKDGAYASDVPTSGLYNVPCFKKDINLLGAYQALIKVIKNN